MTKTITKQLGQQTMVLEPPHMAVLVHCGVVTVEEISAISAELEAYWADKPYIFMLIDMSACTGVTPEARRAIMKRANTKPQALAYIGTSRRTRVLAELILKAVNLFMKTEMHHRFFDTEVEARAWLAEMRQKRAARCAIGGR